MQNSKLQSLTEGNYTAILNKWLKTDNKKSKEQD